MAGLQTLLDLDGVVIEQAHGCWVKIEAWRVPPDEGVPHGVRYSLTLHGGDGRRLMGFDNAHAVRPGGRFRYAGRKLPFDHRHRHASDEGTPYGFADAYVLVKDFFEEVDRVLDAMGPPGP